MWQPFGLPFFLSDCHERRNRESFCFGEGFEYHIHIQLNNKLTLNFFPESFLCDLRSCPNGSADRFLNSYINSPPSLQNNFVFCIWLLLNLCYGVYIPVEKAAVDATSRLGVVCVTGLPARTARPFVPSFFGKNRLAFLSCISSFSASFVAHSGLR